MNKIALLNDAFRSTFAGGKVVMTAGVYAHGAAFCRSIDILKQRVEITRIVYRYKPRFSKGRLKFNGCKYFLLYFIRSSPPWGQHS